MRLDSTNLGGGVGTALNLFMRTLFMGGLCCRCQRINTTGGIIFHEPDVGSLPEVATVAFAALVLHIPG